MFGSSGKPSKASGKAHSAKGSIKQSIGRALGSITLARSGAREHAMGEGEVNAAKTSGYAQGTGDRMMGKKDQVVGALTGDHAQHTRGNVRHTQGAAQQGVNRHF